MKIEAIELDVDLEPVDNAVNVVLGDDSDPGPRDDGQVPGGLIIKYPWMTQERLLQTEQLASSSETFNVGRGNRVDSFDWIVIRAHATESEAIDYALTHNADVPENVNLLITLESGERWKLTRGVLHRVVCEEQFGSSTKYHYYTQGGVLTPLANAGEDTMGVTSQTYPDTISPVTIKVRNPTTGQDVDITFNEDGVLVLPDKIALRNSATGRQRIISLGDDGEIHGL